VPTPATPAPAPYYGNSGGAIQVPPPPSSVPAPQPLAPPVGTSPPAGAPPAGGTTPADRAPSLKPANGGVSTPTRTSQKLAPMADLHFGGERANAANAPSSPPETPRASNLKLRPIPDPDAQRQTPRSLDAPQLLNPRDRVAAVQHVGPGARTAIVWPTSLTRARRTPAASARASRPATSPSPRPAVWDDSGWHSVAH